MNSAFSDFVQPALGKSIWLVRHRVGSMIILDLGKKIEEDFGEYHLWIDCCHWWLQQGRDDTFSDIVTSESNKSAIEQKIQILLGKSILSIELNEQTANTFIDFEQDLFLRMTPYAGKIREQWHLFAKNEVLTAFSDGSVTIKPK